MRLFIKKQKHLQFKGNLMILCLFLPHIIFAATTVKVDPSKRILVAISDDSMNRMAFANDRISQVFGDEEAYTIQTDETRGQIFLKPTEANGEKPISLTVITENGVVQDLELTPQKMATATIILKGEKPMDRQSNPNFLYHPPDLLGFSPMNQTSLSHSYGNGGDRASVLISAIKEVVSQDIMVTDQEEEKPLLLKWEGFKTEGLRVIKARGFYVSVYRLTNTSDDTLEMADNVLKNALAMATLKKIVNTGESTTLYVVWAV